MDADPRLDVCNGGWSRSGRRGDSAAEVVTSVHGTYAREAAWTKPDSALSPGVAHSHGGHVASHAVAELRRFQRVVPRISATSVLYAVYPFA
jgi:hypothetical protein